MVNDVKQDQLALTLTLPANDELNNYVQGRNSEALLQIQTAARGRGEFCLYLWGPQGVGKSHLLQGACKDATFQGLSAIYLKMAPQSTLGCRDLEGLEKLDLVCIDDIHHIAGDKEWEEALFHLYNKMKALNRHLLVSAPMAPMALPVILPDLRTRLGWGVTYHLHALGDEEKNQALRARASQKGLTMNHEVANFIISRSGRSMGELLDALDELDNASLLMQRKLTIPFVKQVLRI